MTRRASAQTAPPFDVCGPLPSGVTVLEASAGTGKTFTIAALVARYVATTTFTLDQLLVITFTRMATGELRERVRERLVSAERGLARALAGAEIDQGDDVLRLLADADLTELDLRRRRLATALADFDAATISTTHGFCQHVLGSLGVAGDVERDITFLEDPRDLVQQVVNDLYVRRFAASADEPLLSLDEALRIAAVAVANPSARLEPAAAPRSTPEGLRRSLAEAVRSELERRKRALRVLTYDDLLTRLAETLRDPVRGPAAAARLRERYRVALVDEFQDTDPVQWDILRLAFAGPGADTTLVLIGDPKQAIYAFRGADVHAYLEASRFAARATLARNWRSDQALIDAYDALFAGVRLGHDEIEYRTVEAAEGNRSPGLRGAPDQTPLRVRFLARDGTVTQTRKGFIAKAAGQRHIAQDLAADVVGLLSSGAEVRDPDAPGGWRPLRPGHLAVLVRTNKQAVLVREALDEVQVPAVINGAGSVFATAAANEWLRLLEALERPSSPVRARAVALTSFLGWDARQVALSDDDAWEDVHGRLHRWADVLRRRGVAALLEDISVGEGLPSRVLARVDGERELTDLRHIGQLLHAAAVEEQLGVTALSGWLRRRVAEAESDTGSEERSRRLESDSEAVQVLTIHRSKGLEFPVVYVPFAWEAGWIDENAPAVYHERAADGRLERVIDVGMGGPDFREHLDRHIEEQRGEELRLLYVALTRAKHQAVLWWAGSWDCRESPLCRLLFARAEAGGVELSTDRPPDDSDVLEVLGALVAEAPGCVNVAPATGWDGRTHQEPQPPPAELTAAPFDRGLDRSWRRASYSSIIAQTGESAVASEPEEPLRTDEPPAGPAPLDQATDAAVEAAAPEPPDPATGLLELPSPLADLPGGVDVGTFVHRVLEHTDFDAQPLEAALRTAVHKEQQRWPILGEHVEDLVAGLGAALRTPLGPLAGERTLAGLRRSDRLDELWFELPLAGGDRPTGAVSISALAELMESHLEPTDPLAGYPTRLAAAAPSLASRLRGYLVGSLDLVWRQADEDGSARFLVADYKTNRLGQDGRPLVLHDYRPAALVAAMEHAHYPLQALLYLVALHRYLRWRIPDYLPERHLGGVLYLFLRGMSPRAPRVAGQPVGVFAWAPPVGLVEAVSALFDRGQP